VGLFSRAARLFFFILARLIFLGLWECPGFQNGISLSVEKIIINLFIRTTRESSRKPNNPHEETDLPKGGEGSTTNPLWNENWLISHS